MADSVLRNSPELHQMYHEMIESEEIKRFRNELFNKVIDIIEHGSVKNLFLNEGGFKCEV